MVLLGYFYFGPVDSSDVAIDLSFVPSTYTEPEDSLLAVTDCSVDYDFDAVVAHSGCTIGGAYSGIPPDCSGGADGNGGGGEEVEPLSASFLGIGVHEGGRRVLIPLRGTGLTKAVEVYLQQRASERPARYVRRTSDVFEFRTELNSSDRGYWDIVVERGADRVVLYDQILVVESAIRTAFEEYTTGEECAPGIVEIKIKPQAFAFPAGRTAASPSEISDLSDELRGLFDRFAVSRLEKVFPSADPFDRGKEVLSSYYRVRFPVGINVGDVLAALSRAADIVSVDWVPKVGGCSYRDTLHPNDPLYRSEEDPCQWDLHQWSEEFPPLADIGMSEAWATLGTASESMLVAILDTGVRYTHEDLGDTNVFPNWLSPCGYDMVNRIRDPLEEMGAAWNGCGTGHGTIVSSVAAAVTNNAKGVASPGWGTTKLAPFKVCDIDAQQYFMTDFMPEAIHWAVDSCHVDAISVSYLFSRSSSLGEAVHYADSAGGVFFCGAAGNSCNNKNTPEYPAAYQYVTGVTQTTRSGCWGDAWQLLSGDYNVPSCYCSLFTQHSPGTHRCDSTGALPVWMTDLAAPGGAQYRDGQYGDKLSVACGNDDQCYTAETGTSLSAPLVAAVGVYLKDRARDRGITLSPEDIQGLLCATADSVAKLRPDGTCSDECYDSYPNTYCGWGKINAQKAALRILDSWPDGKGQLESYTIHRFTATGYDTCWLDLLCEYHGYPQAGDTTTFYRYRLRKSVSYTWFEYDSAEPPFAWGYHNRYGNKGCIADPKFSGSYKIDPDEMTWKWSGVIPSSMTPQGCTLESFLWCYRVNDSPESTWVTVPPDSMEWACGVSGKNRAIMVACDSAEEPSAEVTLGANYPNPFNATTSIHLAIHTLGRTRLQIYDVRGRLVRTLVDGELDSGVHELHWDGQDDSGNKVASGVYFLKLHSRGVNETRKMILIE